jgi:hypothetical protein
MDVVRCVIGGGYFEQRISFECVAYRRNCRKISI